MQDHIIRVLMLHWTALVLSMKKAASLLYIHECWNKGLVDFSFHMYTHSKLLIANEYIFYIQLSINIISLEYS